MTAEDVLDVLDRLDRAGIDWWIDGGWGVDALLGEQSRPHDDLDLVIDRAWVGRLEEIFPEWHRVDHEWWPARFVLRDDRQRQVDFHPVRFDEGGDAWQEQLDAPPARYPREGLDGRGTIGGRAVRCLTPELQLAHHDYPDPDDVDWFDVQRLCARFALDVPVTYRTRPGYVDPKRSVGRAP